LDPGDEPRAPTEEGKKTLEGNATITGNVFSDVRVNVHLQHARGVVLTGNTFWEGYDHDLLVEESSNVVIGPNNFDRNPRYELWQKERRGRESYFAGGEDSSVTGLHANAVRGQAAALMLERCRRMHISDCTILDPEKDGILLRDCRDVLVHGNFIRASHAGFRPAVIEGGGRRSRG
jgi:nitrous oxidase accessory protein NosD